MLLALIAMCPIAISVSGHLRKSMSPVCYIWQLLALLGECAAKYSRKFIRSIEEVDQETAFADFRNQRRA